MYLLGESSASVNHLSPERSMARHFPSHAPLGPEASDLKGVGGSARVLGEELPALDSLDCEAVFGTPFTGKLFGIAVLRQSWRRAGGESRERDEPYVETALDDRSVELVFGHAGTSLAEHRPAWSELADGYRTQVPLGTKRHFSSTSVYRTSVVLYSDLP